MDKNPQTNLQKEHDFMGTFKRPDGFPIIVQVRNPLLSIDSRHKLNVRELSHPDTRAHWTQFHREQIPAWMQFVHRWILADLPDRLVVFYEDLVAGPESVVTRVIEFLRPDEPVDSARLNCALSLNPVEYRKRSITYYNRA
jgi:hypothetical protein